MIAWSIGPPAAYASPARPSPSGAGSRDGTAAVEHMLAVLEALDSAGAARARGSLPRLDSTFGIGLALFLAMAAHGVREWLGRDIAAKLEFLDGGALLDEADAALAAHLLQDVDGRTWRVLHVPLGGAEGKRTLICASLVSDGLQTRNMVVFQVTLRTLGPVQLSVAAGGRELAVVLEMAATLPPDLADELQESFSAALLDSGLAGTLEIGHLGGAWLDLCGRPRVDTAV
ncbi:hypothetical protein [Azospirillum sp. TSO22-1]|uniref:hypothetical protein n=1 Tax=Azospirillum sp. TSO22-1 TaxID=716789 RepID=UPI000D612FA1|nr:hypothetical protein [Azospirillum sp. TSO22-1]PWC35160.1 hypothetical protein TSO221_30290 [Azospirillum sp. TSO22-1]